MMSLKNTAQLYDEYVLPTYGREGLTFVRGEDSYLFDADGTRYLDLYPGWGTACLGHCHPYLVEQVTDQVKTLIHVPNNYYNPLQAQLAEKLAEIGFGGLSFFSNSGAEANEGAIKLARRFGNRSGRYEIITFKKSFHGRTLATLTATGQKKYQEGFEPLPEGFKYARFGDLDSVMQQITDKTCAIMLEPIQGEGGINIPPQQFLTDLNTICRERNILLILDEVQTGIGRTGSYFAYQTFNLDPDVVTLAKSLGGGFPIGAMMVRQELNDILVPGTHASTYGGNPVVCRAALAVIEVIEREKLLGNVMEQSAYIRTMLEQIQRDTGLITDIRICGLMIGIDIAPQSAAVKQQCRDHNILINNIGKNTIRLLPALNISREDITRALDVFKAALLAEGNQ